MPNIPRASYQEARRDALRDLANGESLNAVIRLAEMATGEEAAGIQAAIAEHQAG